MAHVSQSETHQNDTNVDAITVNGTDSGAQLDDITDVDDVYNAIVYGGNHELDLFEDDEGESSQNVGERGLVPEQETPNGSSVYVPIDVPAELKPVLGSIWGSVEAAYEMYQKYAENAGFVVRKASTKHRRRGGEMTHKYFLCNKAGTSKTKHAADTLDVDGTKKPRSVRRNSNYKVTDCKARLKISKIKGSESFCVYGFDEKHNHPLGDEHNKHLSRARRQLTFEDQLFIQTVSTNNIGATKAYRLRATMKGGYENVRGTVVDYKNFKRDINMYIGDRDAQMLVDKFKNWAQCLPEFSFDFKAKNNELSSLFWADETSKCNYKEFGDVIAFDATYRTNKYNMVFVPFTGVDNHNRCVTFGAGLLKKEDIPSYSWLLQAFLKAHKNQPQLVLTDQDPSVKEAVKVEMPNSQHRLCMWHIMKKLPLKVCGDILDNTNFRQRLHKIVWNIYLKPEEFVNRWNSLMKEFDLQDNKWLSRMFKLMKRWIPAYFIDMPLSCVMKTTSRSESSNAFFQIFTHYKHTLVQFSLCFETAMEKQRHAQRVLDEHTTTTFPTLVTPNPIESEPDKLSDFVSKINKLTDETLSTLPQEPEEVLILPPSPAKNKGSGTHPGKRIPAPGEKHAKKRPRQMRECNYCHQLQDNHDQRNCPDKKAKLEAERAAKRSKFKAGRAVEESGSQAAAATQETTIPNHVAS
uniref:protein FAR1-RELATED SEQUENCE 5-like n=1 Tax=Erigeron canadensis TaxID=72917 RepID=UPI001CB94905|nr:protein FAR1-RELATED SEQUENCE 5-like [Erigeron canadensis]